MCAEPAKMKTIRIPACQEHAGLHYLTVTVPWVCIVCDGPRGELIDVLSYDGSRRAYVNGWQNPCGHVETYQMVRDWLRDMEVGS